MLIRTFKPTFSAAIDGHKFRIHRTFNVTAAHNTTVEFIVPAAAVKNDVEELSDLSETELENHPGVVLPVLMPGEIEFSHDDFPLDNAVLEEIVVTDFKRMGGWYFITPRLTLASAAIVDDPDSIPEKDRDKHFVTATVKEG